MSIFKKFLLIPTVSILPLAATMTSCSTIGNLDKTLAAQLEVLTSPEAKQIYENEWSREAFASLYLRTSKGDVSTLKKEKQIVKEYLKNLKVPQGILPPTINGLPNAAFFAGIEKKMYDSFAFYTSWKSSNDPNYFRDKRNDWVEKQLGYYDGTLWKDVLNNFNPDFGYHVPVLTDPKYKKEFLFLYNTLQTGIQNELLNMMISKMYFSNSDSNLVTKGTDYNEIIAGHSDSLKYWDANSFDITSPTYFLEKYLVEKTPRIKWNYASDNKNQVIDWTNKLVKSVKNYNSLWYAPQGEAKNLGPIFSETLAIKGNDENFNKNIPEFWGYNSSIELSETPIEGDLSTNPDVLREFNSTKSGLIANNSITNKSELFSFDQLQKAQDFIKINNNPNTPNNLKAFLPPITIKNLSTTTRKKAKQITIDDLEWGAVTTQNNTYDDGTSKWKVENITPLLNTSDSHQSIKLDMSYFYNYQNPSPAYKYQVIISWIQDQAPEIAEISTELENKYVFSNDISTSFGQKNREGINAIIDGKVSISYYMRLLPIFKWDTILGIKQTTEINGKEKALGKFSLDGTPWAPKLPNGDENLNLQTLIFSLYMQDADILKNMKKTLVLNDIALIPGDVKEVNAILKELGILYISEKPAYASSSSKK